MKTIKYIASLLAGITLFSCDNFEDINTNPDAVTKVSPKLLATCLLYTSDAADEL